MNRALAPAALFEELKKFPIVPCRIYDAPRPWGPGSKAATRAKGLEESGK